MLRWRALCGLAAAALLGLVSPALGVDAGNRAAVGHLAARETGSLAIYYASPVLARAGERVLMPVQVVCAGSGGRACAATVSSSCRPRRCARRSAISLTGKRSSRAGTICRGMSIWRNTDVIGGAGMR